MFFGILLLIPSIITSALMCLVFVLPIESGEKLGFSLTVLLTYMVLLTLVADSLPPISSDISILQLYVTGVVCIGTVVTILTVVNTSIHSTDPEKPIPTRLVTVCSILSALVDNASQVYENAEVERGKSIQNEEIHPTDSIQTTGTNENGDDLKYSSTRKESARSKAWICENDQQPTSSNTAVSTRKVAALPFYIRSPHFLKFRGLRNSILNSKNEQEGKVDDGGTIARPRKPFSPTQENVRHRRLSKSAIDPGSSTQSGDNLISRQDFSFMTSSPPMDHVLRDLTLRTQKVCSADHRSGSVSSLTDQRPPKLLGRLQNGDLTPVESPSGPGLRLPLQGWSEISLLPKCSSLACDTNKSPIHFSTPRQAWSTERASNFGTDTDLPTTGGNAFSGKPKRITSSVIMQIGNSGSRVSSLRGKISPSPQHTFVESVSQPVGEISETSSSSHANALRDFPSFQQSSNELSNHYEDAEYVDSGGSSSPVASTKTSACWHVSNSSDATDVGHRSHNCDTSPMYHPTPSSQKVPSTVSGNPGVDVSLSTSSMAKGRRTSRKQLRVDTLSTTQDNHSNSTVHNSFLHEILLLQLSPIKQPDLKSDDKLISPLKTAPDEFSGTTPRHNSETDRSPDARKCDDTVKQRLTWPRVAQLLDALFLRVFSVIIGLATLALLLFFVFAY